MRYRLLGPSGLRVTELALGTMTFGDDWGWGAQADQCQAIFEAYAQAGGNFIDSSCNYTNGSSERIIGDLVKGDRDRFVIATKYTLTERSADPNFGGNHRKNLIRSVKASLERLQTDHIDLLWLHMWDFTTPIEEVMRGLDDLVRQGTVHYVGFSDTPAWVVARAAMLADLRGWAPVAAVQFPYSLAGRTIERDLLPMARSLGLAVTPWGVLGGGGLTGKFQADGADSKRNEAPGERARPAIEALGRVAAETGRTPSQVAINWVRQQPGNIIPIVGARTAAQMRENLGCLQFTLTPAQIEALTAASPLELGFPLGFLTSQHVRSLIFGETFDRLDSRP